MCAYSLKKVIRLSGRKVRHKESLVSSTKTSHKLFNSCEGQEESKVLLLEDIEATERKMVNFCRAGKFIDVLEPGDRVIDSRHI